MRFRTLIYTIAGVILLSAAWAKGFFDGFEKGKNSAEIAQRIRQAQAANR